VERPDEAEVGVLSLERRQNVAKARLETLLKPISPTTESDPKGVGIEPHQYTYKPSLHPEQDTVIASQGCSEPAVPPVSISPTPERSRGPEKGRVLRLDPDELVRLAPRLKGFLRQPDPTWPDIVDAAGWLRHELDVSKPLWGDACIAMGREYAAIALAIVSTKDPEHFRTTPGGYFHGMVAKHKAGELNLDRTLWALRRAAEPTPRRQAGRGGDDHRRDRRDWS
jgi:replication initiation protein RepC